MRLIKIIMITGLVLFLAASTASAERSLWLTPLYTDGNYIEDAYVGRDENPWLRKSYVVGADPFLLKISNHSLGKGKKDKTAKNVRLVVAINDPAKVDGILIDGVDIWDPDSVEYGIPTLASGRRMPKHGVFPTSFIEFDINYDIPQNGAVELEIDVNGDEGLMVHFDAYGEGRPKKCKSKHHHKYYKDRWYHKYYKYRWHHKYYKDRWHHKHCYYNRTCFRDVFNPFSHDVTVVVEDSGQLPDCGPDELSIVFSPQSLNYILPDRDERAFEISVEPNVGSNCTVNIANIAELVITFPQYELVRGVPLPVFEEVYDVSNPDVPPVPLDNIEHTWTTFSSPILIVLQLFIDNNTKLGDYQVEAYLYDIDSNEISSNIAPVIVRSGVPN